MHPAPPSLPCLKSGFDHSCLVTTRSPHPSLLCWGANQAGQAEPPSLFQLDAVNVALGAWHTCAMAHSRQLSCFGWDRYGQTRVPLHVPSTALDLQLGGNHSCALVERWAEKGLWNDEIDVRDTKGLYFVQVVECWGDNSQGQTQVGREIGVEHGVIGFRLGVTHTCIIVDSLEVIWWHKLVCQGDNYQQQREVPKGFESNVFQIALGRKWTCAVVGREFGSVRCFGRGIDPHYSLRNVQNGVHSLEAGFDRLCVVDGLEDLTCGRREDHGVTWEPEFVPVVLLEEVHAVSVGKDHTCAISAGVGLYCWGQNDQGQCDVPDLGV